MDSMNSWLFRFRSSEECIAAHRAAEYRDKDKYIQNEFRHLDGSDALIEHWWKYGMYCGMYAEHRNRMCIGRGTLSGTAGHTCTC